MINRSSGILLPVFSLPSNYGIGTLGKEAYSFVDFLKNAGQSYWQILPIGPTSYGDSPYQCLSSFAGNPYFIDLDMLVSDGLLSNKDLKDMTLRYIRVNKYLYWSLRKKDYNRLVDSRKAKGVYGEHLIRFRPQYNYAINIDYNPKNIYNKGSAIFLHCTGSHKYTLGCVAIPEKYMKKVLKYATKNMKICIYRK